MTTSDYFGSCYPHEGAAHFRLRLTFRPLSCRALSLRLLPVISARAKQTFGFDLRSLAVMRIGLGGVLAADLLQRSIALKAHYTDEGVLPRALMQGLANPGIGLYRLFGGVGPVIALACVSLLAALALTVGFHTRVACIASWVLLVSLQNRNPFVYHSGDDLLRLALFWGMFLPLGARFSLDAGRDPAPPSGRGNQIISVGTLGLFWQLVCLYLFLFDHKMMGTSWRNGTAVYDALSVEQYRTSFGSALLGFPTLLPLFTHAILVQQALTVVLLVSPILIGPLRLFAVLGVIATQLGFGLCFKLGTFPWITSFATFAVLPGWFWDKLDPAALKTYPVQHAPLPAEEPEAPFRPGQIVKLAMGVLAALSIASITLWNLSQAGAMFGLAGSEISFEETMLARFAMALRLDQRWSMFSPNPQTEDGWFVVEGTLVDGARVDLLPDLVGAGVGPNSADRATARGIRWEKPALISSQFTDQRWLLYFLQLVGAPTAVQLRGFADYVCRFWNGMEPRSQALRRFALQYMRFEHLPEGRTTPVEKIQLIAGSCPGN